MRRNHRKPIPTKAMMAKRAESMVDRFKRGLVLTATMGQRHSNPTPEKSTLTKPMKAAASRLRRKQAKRKKRNRVEMGTGVRIAEYCTPYLDGAPQDIDPDTTAVIVGGDIKLCFCPNKKLKPTNNIWLIQFKKAIQIEERVTADGWAVDKSQNENGGTSPYFGHNNPSQKPNIIRFVRNMTRKSFGKNPSKKGHVLEIGANGVRKRTTHAYVIDLVRDLCPLSKLERRKTETVKFATYAYDEDNNRWLGGVSWGYTISLENNKTNVSFIGLSKRSEGRLRDEENEARKVWEETPTNLPISDTTEEASEVIQNRDEDQNSQFENSDDESGGNGGGGNDDN